jgi:hypothetical protein
MGGHRPPFQFKKFANDGELRATELIEGTMKIQENWDRHRGKLL